VDFRVDQKLIFSGVVENCRVEIGFGKRLANPFRSSRQDIIRLHKNVCDRVVEVKVQVFFFQEDMIVRSEAEKNQVEGKLIADAKRPLFIRERLPRAFLSLNGLPLLFL